MHTKVYSREETRQAILEGVNVLYDAVKETYGPESGNIGILRDFSGLSVTHDGVTVAKSIELKGPARAGAEVVKNIAKKMEKENGDGTSTVTIISKWLIQGVQDRLMLGESPIKVRDELKREADLVVAGVDKLSHELKTVEQLRHIAGIAASDDELGAKIADIVFEVGEAGNVNIEFSSKNEDSGEIINGFTIDNGAASLYMIKDPATLSTTLVTPSIIVANRKFETLESLIPVIQSKVEGPILVIANDFSESAIGKIVDINQAGMKDITFVKSPRFGEKRLEYLKDIAAVVGTKVIEKDEDFGTALGTASKVVIKQDKTVIMGGGGDTTERRKTLADRAKLETDEFEASELKDRIASIDGKAAIFYVGAYSEDEAKEKRDRVEDTVASCQAALRGGFVAGGGTTPLDLAELLPENSALKNALTKPFEILLDNIGLQASDFKAGKGMGVNLRTGEFVNMIEAGVIEPADTIKKAVLSAVSIAGTAITMRKLVEEIYEDD